MILEDNEKMDKEDPPIWFIYIIIAIFVALTVLQMVRTLIGIGHAP